MIPKVIHLCWFSNDPFPVEIKVCIDTWKRLLPDYTIKRWTYEDAAAMNCAFVNEALAERKWTYAADVIRFYALLKVGGIYMDSDIFLKKRFDDFIPQTGFATFMECYNKAKGKIGLQAAFMMGEKGNQFCKDMVDHYEHVHFKNADGSFNDEISPLRMADVAEKYGYVNKDMEQRLDGIMIYPTYYLSPTNNYKHSPKAIGVHRIYGSWRKRKFGRRVEIAVKHYFHLAKYALLKR